MAYIMKPFILLFFIRWSEVFAAPVRSTHQAGGSEHIVIIDKSHPTPPAVAEVLQRLELHESHPDVRLIYNNSAFTGFAASMTTHCLDKLANMSDIKITEKSGYVKRNQQSLTYDTRAGAPWGLQRISTATNVTGSASAMDYMYSFAAASLGRGADIYVVDTGVYTEHNAFSGRARMIWSYDGNYTDADGHGTHVSGTSAGNWVGVASNANILGVKALDSEGGGWSSNVVAGIDFVVQAHDAAKRNQSNFVGSVMSMSLASSSPVQAINSAVEAAVSAAVHTVVAAGNNGEDACNSSPASAGGTGGAAITVGSVGMTAEISSFSNYGDCVDVYAPGENVISAWIGGSNMINSLSGTSMATPHVTGIVAYAMGNKTLANDPGLMKEWVRMTALTLSDGTLLANNGVQAQEGQGIIGAEKLATHGLISTSDQRSNLAKEKRAFSGLDPLMPCGGRYHGSSALRNAWLRNARRTVATRASDWGLLVKHLIWKAWEQVHMLLKLVNEGQARWWIDEFS
ncbi:subtilisin-like protease [Teratosphaeria destructans]|uniref:Subtilisin-like protease n=1 Tax=Teratosphaeria destructans TaxID=418781 RepID=A0A9W7SQZ3_9PEZI|nr:subtilisin-like protease [Teratosphaeria destructans]